MLAPNGRTATFLPWLFDLLGNEEFGRKYSLCEHQHAGSSFERLRQLLKANSLQEASMFAYVLKEKLKTRLQTVETCEDDAYEHLFLELISVSFLYFQNSIKEATLQFQNLLYHCKNQVGADHPLTIVALLLHSHFLSEKGQYSLAKSQLMEVCSVSLAIWGPLHKTTLISFYRWLLLLFELQFQQSIPSRDLSFICFFLHALYSSHTHCVASTAYTKKRVKGVVLKIKELVAMLRMHNCAVVYNKTQNSSHSHILTTKSKQNSTKMPNERTDGQNLGEVDSNRGNSSMGEKKNLSSLENTTDVKTTDRTSDPLNSSACSSGHKLLCPQDSATFQSSHQQPLFHTVFTSELSHFPSPIVSEAISVDFTRGGSGAAPARLVCKFIVSDYCSLPTFICPGRNPPKRTEGKSGSGAVPCSKTGPSCHIGHNQPHFCKISCLEHILRRYISVLTVLDSPALEREGCKRQSNSAAAAQAGGHSCSTVEARSNHSALENICEYGGMSAQTLKANAQTHRNNKCNVNSGAFFNVNTCAHSAEPRPGEAATTDKVAAKPASSRLVSLDPSTTDYEYLRRCSSNGDNYDHCNNLLHFKMDEFEISSQKFQQLKESGSIIPRHTHDHGNPVLDIHTSSYADVKSAIFSSHQIPSNPYTRLCQQFGQNVGELFQHNLHSHSSKTNHFPHHKKKVNGSSPHGQTTSCHAPKEAVSHPTKNTSRRNSSDVCSQPSLFKTPHSNHKNTHSKTNHSRGTEKQKREEAFGSGYYQSVVKEIKEGDSDVFKRIHYPKTRRTPSPQHTDRCLPGSAEVSPHRSPSPSSPQSLLFLVSPLSSPDLPPGSTSVKRAHSLQHTLQLQIGFTIPNDIPCSSTCPPSNHRALAPDPRKAPPPNLLSRPLSNRRVQQHNNPALLEQQQFMGFPSPEKHVQSKRPPNALSSSSPSNAKHLCANLASSSSAPEEQQSGPNPAKLIRKKSLLTQLFTGSSAEHVDGPPNVGFDTAKKSSKDSFQTLSAQATPTPLKATLIAHV